MSSSDDASLLIRCTQTDDSRALDELAARYVDFIYAAALRQTKNDAAMAADVTQAVLLVLGRRGGSVRPARLSAWLHRVTVYAAKNACRGEARRRRHERAAAVERQEAVMPADDTDSVHNLLAPLFLPRSGRDGSRTCLRLIEPSQTWS